MAAAEPCAGGERGGDPCPVARKLAQRGVDLQFNAIGLAVNSKARAQLQCIAKAGDGAYYDTKDTESLGQAVRKLTQRALRPFEVTGTPVKGTTRAADAPTIRAGQYRDSYNTSGTSRYYTIDRTAGSLVTASVGTVVRTLNGGAKYEGFHLSMTTLDGEQCSNTARPAGAEYAAIVYGAAVRSASSESTTKPPRGCTDDPQLRLTMNRTSGSGGGGTVPVELVITEQPPVTNRDALPESVVDYDGRGKAVVGTSPVRRLGVLQRRRGRRGNVVGLGRLRRDRPLPCPSRLRAEGAGHRHPPRWRETADPQSVRPVVHPAGGNEPSPADDGPAAAERCREQAGHQAHRRLAPAPRAQR